MTACGGLLREIEGHKTLITDMDELKQRLRTEWAKLNHVIASTVISGIVDGSR